MTSVLERILESILVLFVGFVGLALVISLIHGITGSTSQSRSEQLQETCIKQAVINNDYEKIDTCLKITEDSK